MGINAVFTISFEEEVSDEKRFAFYGVLHKDGWSKASGVNTNCWKTIFKNGVTESSAINVIKHDVDRAIKKSKILKYKIVIQLDGTTLESFDDY